MVSSVGVDDKEKKTKKESEKKGEGSTKVHNDFKKLPIPAGDINATDLQQGTKR